MEGFEAVRRLARAKHDEALKTAGDSPTAVSLLAAAAEITGIHCQPVPAGDSLLQGGDAVLVPSAQSLFYNQCVSKDLAAFLQAHEFGHHWLDDAAEGACSSNETDVSAPEERAPLGLQRVEGYGPRERRETQANVFAREFLLPTPEASRLYLEEHLSANAISERLGVPLALVYQQLALALLIPEEKGTEGESSTIPKIPPLDDSQRQAAEVETGPFLLEAGPGTGKTRTLIARIEALFKRGVEPTNILGLTFSNKAAGEMRERIAVSSPNATTAIWTGTFHAFGLEILRKWGHLIGLPKEVRVVDSSDALFLLETELLSLRLDHYLRLADPVVELQHILKAVSRAKDELVEPDTYRVLGERMLASAGMDEDALLAAQKVLEVAGVYETYEQLLRKAGAVDFGDLINRSIELLKAHPAALAELRRQYTYVLVDEYQDVNRASSVLLKLITDKGKGLWVVGDARQSIYRFRGASPNSIREFERDFPGSRRMALDTNYRSRVSIIRLMEAFAPGMRASMGAMQARWNAPRGSDGGGLLMEVASDLDAEARGLAKEIERQQKRGIPYRDQAILCRSHLQLARFASLLEALSVPILYLGDLFERPEIRDLLSLISFVSEPERGGLLRVAAFPEYSIPTSDVRKVLAFAVFEKCDPLAALRRLPEIRDVTEAGLRGLTLLASHINAVGPATLPSWFLSDYLFTRSRYLAPLLADSGIGSQTKRVAVFQLVQFALERDVAARRVKGDPKRELLSWIRRLEILGEERQLRQIPMAANGIDAVRMLTVHASKGLEFDAVYLPGLGAQIFPVSQRYNPSPPPRGMLPDDSSEAHQAEEECLFFVAMSRARDVLCISRAERYSDARKMSASPYLMAIVRQLPTSPQGPARWVEASPILKPSSSTPGFACLYDSHEARDLDQYLRCPRQYLYQRVFKISGAREDNAYVNFHRCVYHVLQWMNQRVDGKPLPSSAEAAGELEKVWRERGPVQHPYNALYWAAAAAIVKKVIVRGATSSAQSIQASWEIPRPRGALIKVQPDQVELANGNVIVRRLRTGRHPKNPPPDSVYALYHAGAAAAHPGARIKVEIHYLATDKTVDIGLSPTMVANRLKKYDEVIAALAEGKFPPEPEDERECPRCPQYFICAALPPFDVKP